MATITPRDLTEESAPAAASWLVVDTGSAVRKTAIEDVMDVGRPFASQSEAETGSGTTQTMNPLTTKQAIDYARTQAKTFTGIQTFTPSSISGESLVVSVADDTSASGPFIENKRISASPAASDILGSYRIKGSTSTGNEKAYAQLRGRITDPTNGAEGGQAEIVVPIGGAQTVVAYFGEGLLIGAATGGLLGTGHVNAEVGYSVNGSALASSLFGITPGSTGLAILQDTSGAAVLTEIGGASLAGNTFTGTQLLPTGGSASAPVLSFAGDTDTGIYRAAENDLAIATGGYRNSRFINTGTQQHFLTQVAGARFEIQKHSSPTTFSSNNAAFIVQTELLTDVPGGGIISGLAYMQMDKDCDGLVTLGTPDGSSTVWCGMRTFVFNTGDGSTNGFATNVTVQDVGAVGYNEGGAIVAQVANASSVNAALTGAELLLMDSNDSGSTNFDTIMNIFNARLGRWNAGSELAYYFNCTAGGTEPGDAIIGLNENGLAEVKVGIDFRPWDFTTGVVAAFPNDTAIAWEDSTGTTHDIIEVNSTNDTYVRAAGATRSVILSDGAGSNRFSLSSSAINIRLPGAASLVAITAGANDSGGAGFKVLRIPN